MSDEDGGLDLEAMMEQMRVLTEYANENLADAQKQIGYGSYWARFYDIKNRIVIFGYVETLDEMESSERDLGADDGEAAYIRTDTNRRHNDGYMYGMCYSTITPEGELGFTHRADIWPITARPVRDVPAGRLGRRPRRPGPGRRRLQLAPAYAEYATHTNSLGAQRSQGHRAGT